MSIERTILPAAAGIIHLTVLRQHHLRCWKLRATQRNRHAGDKRSQDTHRNENYVYAVTHRIIIPFY
jgi:hypothetical protein